jgi:hypothetical protein
MRVAFAVTAAATMLAIIACQGDAPLAPTRPGHSDQNPNIPPELFANYTKVELSGTGSVVDLNDGGDAVGISAGGGVLWHGPTHVMSTLPIIPAAIANDGTIAGNLDGHAVVWRNGNVVVLDTAPSTALAICRCPSGTVVGSVEVNGQQHAAIWVGDVRIDAGVPPGGTSAEFRGISNGFVVGDAIVPTVNPATGATENSGQGFAWSHAGGWRQLASTGTLASFVAGVNSHGTSVGAELDILNPDLLGVMYDSTGGRIPLFGDPSFLREIIPSAISNSGTIAANFPDNAGGSIALVFAGVAHVLPPGNPGDVATSINSSNVIGGQSDGKPVLWVPSL